MLEIICNAKKTPDTNSPLYDCTHPRYETSRISRWRPTISGLLQLIHVDFPGDKAHYRGKLPIYLFYLILRQFSRNFLCQERLSFKADL